MTERFVDMIFNDRLYRIGSEGTIISPFGRVLKIDLHSKGYAMVEIWSIRKKVRVHRLVALCHIPNPEGKPQVNHINGIKTDNRASNLEWVTDRENKIHGYAIGLYKKKAA